MTQPWTFTRQPPGRRAHGNVRVSVMLPPDLLEWGKHQEDGLSGLLRRLMRAEYRRQQREAPTADAPQSTPGP